MGFQVQEETQRIRGRGERNKFKCSKVLLKKMSTHNIHPYIHYKSKNRRDVGKGIRKPRA